MRVALRRLDDGREPSLDHLLLGRMPAGQHAQPA